MESAYLFIMILPLVAFLYAAVGHGGASGYLALMAILSFATSDMKLIALILNLFVAGIGFYLFWKRGYFRLRLFGAFAVGSIPAAFLGGKITIDPFWYRQVLAFLLLIAVLRMLNLFGGKIKVARSVKMLPAILIGCVIGFFSGIIGIGGGIILSPVILILGWGNLKETAAVSALFIFVNSGAGLLGALSSGIGLEVSQLVLLFCVVFAVLGGFLGARWGSRHENLAQLRIVLALVLLFAAVKLILV